MGRLLLLAIGFILAMPPGWCCAANRWFVPSKVSEEVVPVSQPQPASEEESCPRCRKEAPKPVPKPDPERKHTPKPLPFCGGPCCDRDMTAPDNTELPDTTPSLPMAFVPAPHAVAGICLESVGLIHTPTGPPRHLLLCVWLC